MKLVKCRFPSALGRSATRIAQAWGCPRGLRWWVSLNRGPKHLLAFVSAYRGLPSRSYLTIEGRPPLWLTTLARVVPRPPSSVGAALPLKKFRRSLPFRPVVRKPVASRTKFMVGILLTTRKFLLLVTRQTLLVQGQRSAWK